MTAGRTAFWAGAAAAATDVPAEGRERASWLCRNLAELALMLEAADEPVDPLDGAVRAQALDAADVHYAERLRALRARRGPVPEWFPAGTKERAGVTDPSPGDRAAATAMFAFTARLDDSAPEPEPPQTGGLDGRVEAAVKARARWRPLPEPAEPHGWVEVTIPTDLIWRSWMVLPERGVVRLISDDPALVGDDHDISIGVHDATHMDHVACFDTSRTTPIEFGMGLLATESLAMASEVLAAAEAAAGGRATTQTSARAALARRTGRLPGCAGMAREYGVESEGDEFEPLPTLARAYVAGPLRMIATGFSSRYLSGEVAERYASRWARAESGWPAALALGEAARAWWAVYATHEDYRSLV